MRNACECILMARQNGRLLVFPFWFFILYLFFFIFLTVFLFGLSVQMQISSGPGPGPPPFWRKSGRVVKENVALSDIKKRCCQYCCFFFFEFFFLLLYEFPQIPCIQHTHGKMWRKTFGFSKRHRYPCDIVCEFSKSANKVVNQTRTYSKLFYTRTAMRESLGLLAGMTLADSE